CRRSPFGIPVPAAPYRPSRRHRATGSSGPVSRSCGLTPPACRREQP
ncbi:MAG: hypothetical protein AVDCRST_MAG59-278, partial [uncultured Thermomicrobiales bacterium]